METIFKDASCKLLKNTEIDFNKDSYIVSINDNIIGHFNLKPGIFNNKISISLEYELLKEYRGRGIGNYFLEIIENYVKNNFDMNEIILLIKYDNELSKLVAIKNGYSINYEYMDLMNLSGEMTNYIPFYKNINNKKKMLL